MNKMQNTGEFEAFRNAHRKKTGTILIVDDEDSYRKMISRILEQSGFQTLEAATTQEAMGFFKSCVIDVCLLDINMPGQSGDKFLKAVKHSYPDVAFIMSTGLGDVDMAARCQDLGAEDYLLKPFEGARLLIILNNVLERRRLAQDNKFYRTQMERKLKEQEEKLRHSHNLLVQQEKLAAIGQLAAGVAHEINNPLGFISSNLNTLQRYTGRISDFINRVLASDFLSPEQRLELQTLQTSMKIPAMLEDLPELVAETLDGTERINKIVQSLKSFSRMDDDRSQPVQVNDCLERAITVVWNEIKYVATVDKDLQDLPTIQGYPQQLSQAFMNLLVNAAHAITADGIIQVATAVVDENIQVVIKDNGCGIAAEHLPKIFDPFFTTKEAGKGTGLGMSITNDIIFKHGGTIDVHSVLQQGTTFTLSLPLTPRNSEHV